VTRWHVTRGAVSAQPPQPPVRAPSSSWSESSLFTSSSSSSNDVGTVVARVTCVSSSSPAQIFDRVWAAVFTVAFVTCTHTRVITVWGSSTHKKTTSWAYIKRRYCNRACIDNPRNKLAYVGNFVSFRINALRRKAATDKLVEKIVKHDSWPIQPDILSPRLLRLTSRKPLWLDLQPVDIKSRWRHNWKSARWSILT